MTWLGAWLEKLLPRPKEPPHFANIAPESEWHQAARARGQLPVYSDWVGVFTIDRTGRSFFAEYSDLRDQIDVVDPKDQHVVRWLASERHAELSHLTPIRRAEDRTCSGCSGSGRPSYSPPGADNLICECGGAGWLPVDSTPRV